MLTPRKGMSRLWSWSPSNKIQLAHQKDFQGLCARQRCSTCTDKHDLYCAGLVCKQMTVTFGKMPDALVRQAMCTVLVIQQIPTNCVQANDDKLRVLPHIIFNLLARRPQLTGNPGHAGPGFFSSKNGLDISEPLEKRDRKVYYKTTTNRGKR